MVIKLKSIILFALIFAGIIFVIKFGTDNSAVMATESFTVIIDPGHGGADGGAFADDMTCEKDINLKVALKLANEFQNNKFNVVLTRDSDRSLCGDGKFIKNADMKKRIEIANSYPNSIYISIHCNKFEQSIYWGTQVFYCGSIENSKQLAENIQRSIKLIQPQNNRVAKDAKNSLYLRKISNPSVVVECGFLSNAEELEKLKDEDYQALLAKCIYSGCLEFLKGV